MITSGLRQLPFMTMNICCITPLSHQLSASTECRFNNEHTAVRMEMIYPLMAKLAGIRLHDAASA